MRFLYFLLIGFFRTFCCLQCRMELSVVRWLQGKAWGTDLSTTIAPRMPKRPSIPWTDWGFKTRPSRYNFVSACAHKTLGCVISDERVASSRFLMQGPALKRSRVPTCMCQGCPRTWPNRILRHCSVHMDASLHHVYYATTSPVSRNWCSIFKSLQLNRDVVPTHRLVVSNYCWSQIHISNTWLLYNKVVKVYWQRWLLIKHAYRH